MVSSDSIVFFKIILFERLYLLLQILIIFRPKARTIFFLLKDIWVHIYRNIGVRIIIILIQLYKNVN